MLLTKHLKTGYELVRYRCRWQKKNSSPEESLHNKLNPWPFAGIAVPSKTVKKNMTVEAKSRQRCSKAYILLNDVSIYGVKLK